MSKTPPSDYVRYMSETPPSDNVVCPKPRCFSLARVSLTDPESRCITQHILHRTSETKQNFGEVCCCLLLVPIRNFSSKHKSNIRTNCCSGDQEASCLCVGELHSSTMEAKLLSEQWGEMEGL